MSDLSSNNDQFQQNLYPNDEIDLKELVMVLWSGKWLISAITGVAAVVSVVFALSLPNIYTSSVLVAPAETSGGGFSGLMKQYGAVASFAGMSLPGGDEGSRAQLGLELMKSRAFIGRFVERHGILPELMAAKDWDAGTGKLVFDPELYDAASSSWIGEGQHGTPKPSLQAAHEAFIGILAVSQDKQTGYVTVSVDHYSPIIAAKWVTWLIEDVNAAVKDQDVREAVKSIEYLQTQVANTALTDLQNMFFELIQSQTETVMLAEVRPEYVFKTIDPAIVPEKKSKPGRARICVLGTIIGGMLAVLIVFLRRYVSFKTNV